MIYNKASYFLVKRNFNNECSHKLLCGSQIGRKENCEDGESSGSVLSISNVLCMVDVNY